MTLPIVRATVHDIVTARNAALVGYAKAHDALVAAQAVFEAAHRAGAAARGGARNGYSHNLDMPGADKITLHLTAPDRDLFLDVARRVTDIGAWAHVIELTGLEKLMDKKAKDELRASFTKDPPEITEDNILATVENFALQAETIFRRGIAEAFSALDRRFKSHDGWKIGSRVILSYAFDSWGHWNYHRNHEDTFRDIERTFCILDNRDPIAFADGAQGIIPAIRKERGFSGGGARQSEVENDYFKVRIFQNGNAHIWFKRDDLVEKVNKLLAEYYGAVIPEERSYADDGGLHEPKTTPAARDFAFFPTPDDLAERIIYDVPRAAHDAPGPLLALEPSAGSGALARRLVDRGMAVDCVELDAGRAAELRNERRYRTVVRGDFLMATPVPDYDRVVMNPPFDRERDIDHVMHALKFLKPGGHLTAIMSAGTEYRETRKSTAFRANIAKLNGEFRDLPAGSFASVGTNCNTIVLRVWADGQRRYG